MQSQNFCCCARSAEPEKDVLHEFREHPLARTRRTGLAEALTVCPTADRLSRQPPQTLQASHMHNKRAEGWSERPPPGPKSQPDACWFLMTLPTRQATDSSTQESPTTELHFLLQTQRAGQSPASPLAGRRKPGDGADAAVHSAAPAEPLPRLPNFASGRGLTGQPHSRYRQPPPSPQGTSAQRLTEPHSRKPQRLVRHYRRRHCGNCWYCWRRTLTVADALVKWSAAGVLPVCCVALRESW
mmetsp:Transcript_56550/g.123984  ORF Transcript_56550/g.123984 Transcript_56550/m.123984 type:complete len:242 (+) Transcript_56550:86-811(+)